MGIAQHLYFVLWSRLLFSNSLWSPRCESFPVTQLTPFKRKTVVVQRGDHQISRKQIDPDALKVLYRLQRAGFKAYLVGGGVRDLLLGCQPKDFDVSTDARPQQIKRLFNNCFLIGRRFRLAHIRYSRDSVIETSTFRSAPPAKNDASDPEADLFHQDDNQFGTPAEDAQRRDFTINGLFYDIDNFSVIDHVGGLPDLKKRLIRCIGDPELRFREDPVRMLRGVRFAARLGFRVERRTWKAMLRHHGEIAKAAPARMLEDIYKLFGFSSGEASFRLLHESKLLSVMLPEIDAYLNRGSGKNAPMWRYLAALDSGEHWRGKPTPVLIFAALYCAPIMEKLEELEASGDHSEHVRAIRDLLAPLAERYNIPKRVRYGLIDAISMQGRLREAAQASEGNKGRRRVSKKRLMSHESFTESMALFEMRVAAGDEDPKLLAPWHNACDDANVDLGLIPEHVLAKRRPRGRPRRRVRKPAGAEE